MHYFAAAQTLTGVVTALKSHLSF